MTAPSASDVAIQSGTGPDFVQRVIEAGILRTTADGDLPADAAAVVRTVRVLHDAGFEPELVGWAIAEGHLSLAFLDQFSPPQAEVTEQRYEQLVEERGGGGRALPTVYAALGLPEPDPTAFVSRDEAALIAEFIDVWTALSPADDAAARGARIVGEGTRRMVEAFLDLWDEVARADGPHRSSRPIRAPGGELSVRMAALLPPLLAWLERRHAEASVHARIIRSFEDALERLGRLPARPRQVPAIAFIDLAGYTRLTEEAGDELAARSAIGLQELSAALAARHGGRLVKLLGDGVLVRFPDATSAVRAVAELLPRLRNDGLPAGHAGVASGPLIDRAGDVYGRTVNLAARLASVAGPNELLVTADVVESVDVADLTFVPAGDARLKGFDKPIPTFRLDR